MLPIYIYFPFLRNDNFPSYFTHNINSYIVCMMELYLPQNYHMNSQAVCISLVKKQLNIIKNIYNIKAIKKSFSYQIKRCHYTKSYSY